MFNLSWYYRVYPKTNFAPKFINFRIMQLISLINSNYFLIQIISLISSNHFFDHKFDRLFGIKDLKK